MTPGLRAFVFVFSIGLFLATVVFLYRRAVRDTIDHAGWRTAGAAFIGLGFLGIPLARFGLRGVLLPPWVAIAMQAWWGLSLGMAGNLAVVDVAKWAKRRWHAWRPVAPAAPAQPGAVVPAAQVEDPARRLFLSRATAVGAGLASGGLVGFGMYRALEPATISEVPLRIVGLPRALDGFTIVQLSDIHVGAAIQARFVDQLIAVANAAKPDLVAITGDIVDGVPSMLGPIVARFRNLRARHGTFFSTGNHEYYSGWAPWAPVLSSFGFRVLQNEHAVIADGFTLAGVDDWGTRGFEDGYDLDAALQGRDPERPVVLMAHQPQNLEEVATRGVALQLSGHTHGGQIFPGTLVGTAIWGDLNQGLSRVENTWQYTSRGCGFVGPPMRLGAPPEVVKIVLVAG